MTTFYWKKPQAKSQLLCSNELQASTEPNNSTQPNCQVCVKPNPPVTVEGPSITKTIDAQTNPWSAGGTIDYEFTVTNDTGEQLTGVEIYDVHDPGAPIVIGTMEIDDVVIEGFTYTITAADVTAGTITNVAFVTGEGAVDSYLKKVTLVSTAP